MVRRGLVRCVFLNGGATLSGFTLTGGSAFSGGGAYGRTRSNCTLNLNAATGGGGAAAYCALNNCMLRRNEVYTEPCFCSPSAYGGGAYECTLNSCMLTGNAAYAYTSSAAAGFEPLGSLMASASAPALNL